MERNKIYVGHCLDVLRTFADNSIDCCVTSPPYYGLRDYGSKEQTGLEETPEIFIQKLVEIFEEVRRVLKPSGTCWVNMGDSYSGSGKGVWNVPEEKKSKVKETYRPSVNPVKTKTGLKAKDLIGIPWMLAFALRSAGWYLRQDIIWSKPNPMPESVTDRCTKSHEYIFLLSKSANYYFDSDGIKEPATSTDNSNRDRDSTKLNNTPGRTNMGGLTTNHYLKKNKRSVWNVATNGYKEAHFATFPEKLIIDCIKAGSSELGCCNLCGAPYERIVSKELVPTKKASYNSKVDARDLLADKQDQGSNRMKDGHKPGHINKTETLGWEQICDCSESGIVPSVILDPFMGAGTTALVSRKLGRDYVGIELNPEYIKLANKRLEKELGMFI